MGRHSGALCRVCQQCILVRHGRFIEHSQQFPILDKSVTCVGSHSTAPDDWALQECLTSASTAAGHVVPDAARAS